MRETVVEFGPARRLVGILTRDTPSAAAADDVAVLITNSGIIHRVGPHRLHVRLARFLAARGYPVLRYDLPGIGDSESAGGDQVAQAKLAGTRAAMDQLQRMGVAKRFVVMGICSGADHSLLAAVVDPRVAGAITIDPTTVFPTRRHRVNRVLRRASRLLVPRVVWRLVTGRYSVLRRLSEPSQPPAFGMPRAPEPDDLNARQQAIDALSTVVQKNARLLMLMTGHTHEVFSYPGQIVDAFPEVAGLEGILTVRHLPAAGHTFGSERERERLEQLVLEWLGTLPAHSVPQPERASSVA